MTTAKLTDAIDRYGALNGRDFKVDVYPGGWAQLSYQARPRLLIRLLFGGKGSIYRVCVDYRPLETMIAEMEAEIEAGLPRWR